MPRLHKIGTTTLDLGKLESVQDPEDQGNGSYKFAYRTGDRADSHAGTPEDVSREFAGVLAAWAGEPTGPEEEL